MSPSFYTILHVSSLLVLTGATFYGFAGAPETRKKVLVFAGVASLLMLISGVGLIHKLGYGWPTWVIIKLTVWLVLSALAGIGYRKRAQAPVLIPVVFVLLLVSVVTVYTKPFLGN
jgi:hypothetical protein